MELIKMNDIVQHLRRLWVYRVRTVDDLVSIYREAADEIERLREQLRLANIDNPFVIPEAERLKEERDEARRLYCDHAIRNSRVYRVVGNDTVRCRTPQEVAEKMGWDCFKENI